MAFDVWVDFNTMSDGRISSLTAFVAPGATLTAGDVVVVGDGEGTVAHGRVEAVTGGVVTLTVDQASITSEAPPAARATG